MNRQAYCPKPGRDVLRPAGGQNRALQVGSPRRSHRVLPSMSGSLLAAALLLLLARLITPPAAASQAPPPVTFSRDVAPILQANCQECHRPGGIAPFSLLTYADAKPRAALIQHYTQWRIMPPWKAADGYGEFQNARRLTAEEIDTIGRWVEAGALEGDPADLPPSRPFTDGWRLGTPDVVLDAGADFPVRAGGGDFFHEFVLPFQPKEDVWVTAMEVVPGSSAVVHHVGVYIDPQGKSLALDQKSPGVGYPGPGIGFSPSILIDFWTPGGTPRFLAPGTAWKIPANASLVMDIHYSPNGQPQADRTRIGLHFAKGPVDKRVRFSSVGNVSFKIPAGVARHAVAAGKVLPEEIHLVSGWPHMHWLGREMKITASLPGGIAEPILWVPEYDFHWQLVYVLKEPLGLAKGSRIDLIAYYDNSDANPHNPNRPPRAVGPGERTRDEMCFFFFHYTVDAEHLTQGVVVEHDGIELRE